MAKKETAEQKLLRIIEATKKAQESSSAPAVAVKKPALGFSLGITQINFFLVVAVIAGLVYCAHEVVSGMSGLQEDVAISAAAVAPKESLNSLVPQMKSIAQYLDQIRSRNIFQPYEKKEAQDQGESSAKAALEKQMQKYKLVGVAWLDVPESATVMIEDSTNGTTRFLKEGDKIEDVTVKTIYTDRVVVGHANEEMVIKL